MSISDSVTAVGLSKVIVCPYLIQWISVRWSYVLIRFSDFSESYHTSTVRLKGGPMSLCDSVTSVSLIIPPL